MGRRPRTAEAIDVELDDLPPEMRWRVWMARVEAVIFASPTPVTREVLARVVGKSCRLDMLIEDIRAELGNRPYELVADAGGWRHRTRAKYADAIRLVAGVETQALELTKLEILVVTAIAYFQPITRRDLSAMLGREISRDTLADLRSLGLIANGPRSPRAGAPNSYVTTARFLSQFGFNTLQDLPDRQAIETAKAQDWRSVNQEETADLFDRSLDASGEPQKGRETYEDADFG